LGAARASVGRARRLVAARRTARSAACVRNAARGALPSDRCDLRAGIITQLTAKHSLVERRRFSIVFPPHTLERYYLVYTGP